ncbi:MAG: 3-deoxy-7-phosphoheptulonate synthase [Candidatus Symbiodolus clandestinus]
MTPTTQLVTPQALSEQLPLSLELEAIIHQYRDQVKAILSGEDQRLLVVMGPCSIHDVNAAFAYAQQLNSLQQRYQQALFIIMRTYFEKPRTVSGWRGLIYDPYCDGSMQINQGLQLARQLSLQINQLGLPTATEFLNSLVYPYIENLITWGTIGARTSESQQHRELASAIRCPIGFKNNTAGDIQVAIDAIRAAREPQMLLTQNQQGIPTLYHTPGNPFTHLILRGGRQPNYQAEAVADACRQLHTFQLPQRLLIDCSHGNCQKNYQRQLVVIDDLCQQLRSGSLVIAGVMIESFLVPGNQANRPRKFLTYGQSITDPCLGWSDSEHVLAALAEAITFRSTSPDIP